MQDRFWTKQRSPDEDRKSKNLIVTQVASNEAKCFAAIAESVTRMSRKNEVQIRWVASKSVNTRKQQLL